jgi:aryl-alcohol dehydrogenase-like predicted oxidoreductase
MCRPNAAGDSTKDIMTALGFSPSPLTLGTAQLRSQYGIANRTGRPSDKEALAILDAAVAGDIGVLDTARAYGDAETCIGGWRADRGADDVRIVTKIPPLRAGGPKERIAALREHIDASRSALGMGSLDLVLMHRESDLLDNAVVDAFLEAIECGTVRAFGASLYSPSVGLELLERVPMAALQIPASLVDRRFERAGVLTMAQSQGVALFIRSAFLQGALLLPPDSLPSHLEELSPAMRAIHEFCDNEGCSISEVLVLAIRDLPGVSSIVLGVERAAQLEPHINAIAAPPLAPERLAALRDRIGIVPERLVNPSCWPRA